MAVNELFGEEYKVDLEVFEGPLDLLLYLIRRDELDIYDIPIGKITEQYMNYLEMMRQLNLDVAGEFIVMAATLMVIKSRMLLPVDRRVSETSGDEEWVDPRLDLVRQPANLPNTNSARRNHLNMAEGGRSLKKRRPIRKAPSPISAFLICFRRFRMCWRGSTKSRRKSSRVRAGACQIRWIW